LTGLPAVGEIEDNKLPRSLAGTVKEVLNAKTYKLKGSRRQKGAADCFNYRIIIENERKAHVFECDELDLDNDVKGLVQYILKDSNKQNSL
jgi:hypothetical protein